LRTVAHAFLNAEVVDAEVEVQRGRHTHGAEIGGAVRSGPHVMQLGQVRDLPEMTDATGPDHRRADVVDELFLNQEMAILNDIEDFAHGQRRRRVLANQAETLLYFGGDGIFEPEQMVRLE